MAACAFSTLCVGRHATARTRSLASQWSAPRPGVAVRPPALPQLTAVGSSSSYEFSTLSGSSKLGLQQSISGKDGGESTFDSAAFTSLVALAAASSMAMISSGSNYSAAAEPKPMATSDFAAPTASLQGAHSSEAPTKSHPKVQIRRTVRRLFSSDSDKNNKQKTQSELPRRFQFYRTADCDPAFTEDQKRDVLSAAKPYNVSVPVSCSDIQVFAFQLREIQTVLV